MTRARFYALAALVGACCLGHTSANAQSGPPLPAYGGPGSSVDPGAMATPPCPDPMGMDQAPWYGSADDVQGAARQFGPIKHFDGAFVRVEYLNYTISKPGNVLLGAPVLGVADPTQPFIIFAPGSDIPAGVARVPTTSSMNLGSMSGIQVTGGLNLIDDGTIEVSAFMLGKKRTGYKFGNLGTSNIVFDVDQDTGPGGDPPNVEIGEGEFVQVPNSFATSVLVNGQVSDHLLLYNQSFEATFTSQLWGAEANYLCDVDAIDCFHVRPLLGARYLNLTERLTQIGVFEDPLVAAPPIITTIDSRTTNNLYGGQIGFRAEVVTKYVEFGVTPKVLFLGDTMVSQVSTDNLRTNLDGHVATSNVTSTFTFAGDATSYVQINLSKNFSLRGGYNVIYINRVTRPHTNILYNDNGPNNPPGIVSNLIFRDILISGFTVGGQFTW